MDTITPVAQYIEAHLQRMRSNCLSDGDILNLLGGEGGIQVDVVFYLVSNRMIPKVPPAHIYLETIVLTVSRSSARRH